MIIRMTFVFRLRFRLVMMKMTITLFWLRMMVIRKMSIVFRFWLYFCVMMKIVVFCIFRIWLKVIIMVPFRFSFCMGLIFCIFIIKTLI